MCRDAEVKLRRDYITGDTGGGWEVGWPTCPSRSEALWAQRFTARRFISNRKHTKCRVAAFPSSLRAPSNQTFLHDACLVTGHT